ncbi:Tyrosine-protein phosphatase non-receptor type 1 [Kappamyces sp. JEL0829]|nr:Tyrosine-protein phosphatase non-receptor type 1 [Kappamyces sp. JEL0829]
MGNLPSSQPILSTTSENIHDESVEIPELMARVQIERRPSQRSADHYASFLQNSQGAAKDIPKLEFTTEALPTAVFPLSAPANFSLDLDGSTSNSQQENGVAASTATAGVLGGPMFKRAQTIAERRAKASSVGALNKPSSPAKKATNRANSAGPAELLVQTRTSPPAKSLTTVKPPRLDTRKIAIMSSQKTPEFSPLSANSSNRATLFLEMCLILYRNRYLPLWYRDWTTNPDVNAIRSHTSRLFAHLQDLEKARHQDPSYSMRIAHAPHNISLNRYPDVSPFDQTRVVLTSRSNDYINASYITSPDVQKRYIATQGPLPSTFGDFWHMVWEQHSAVIVMLTKEEETGRLKCHRYWPEKVGQTKRYHKVEGSNSVCFKIFYAEEILMADGVTTIRELIVKREMLLRDHDEIVLPEIRLIRILHFTAWDDHDSCDARALLSVIDLSNEINRLASSDMIIHRAATGVVAIGPMVIHCSAGIGRTGTFCTADTVIHLLTTGGSLPEAASAAANEDTKPLRDDLIAITLNHYRKQRGGFVQTSSQFQLLYEVVLLRMADHFHQKLPPAWPCMEYLD